jgi:hypothetical protein
MKLFYSAIFVTFVLLVKLSAAHAAPISVYPVDGADCTGEAETLVAVNRRFTAACNVDTCHLLTWTKATSIVFNDGATFSPGAGITYNGIASGFTCQVIDMELFAPGTR